MPIDFIKIINAFRTKINPTEKQKELAEKRLSICSTCQFKRGDIESSLVNCGACGCFIHGKIFTNKYGECPKGKWDEVDIDYFEIKKNKTLR